MNGMVPNEQTKYIMQTLTHSIGCRPRGWAHTYFILFILVLGWLASAWSACAQSDVLFPAANVNQRHPDFAKRVPSIAPGDIVYTDSGDAIVGGAVIKIDRATRQSQFISVGGLLNLPSTVVIEDNGSIVVVDSGRLIRIDPATGIQTPIADNTIWPYVYPYDVDLSPQGNLFVANLQTLVGIDHLTGNTRIIAGGGNFVAVISVTCAEKGVYVLNRGQTPQVICIDPKTGAQQVITEGNLLKAPQSLSSRGNDIYVTDVATSDGNFGIGRIVHVDARTGVQQIVSQGGWLVGPFGITMEDAAHILVADPYTINPASPNLYDGAILRIELRTGQQELLVRGSGAFVNPRGVAVNRQPNK